jgi:hypothetical protein
MERLNDLHGAFKPADERHLPDPVEAAECVLDLLVGQLGHFAEAAPAGDGDGHHRAGVDVELVDDRRLGAGGELAQDRVDLPLHLLLGHVAVFL